MDADTRLPAANVPEGAGEKPPPPDIEQVVAMLVHCIVSSAQPGTDVVLDVTVDGFRCLILRIDDLHAIETLSPREREIARMVADGLTNKSIAHVLDISLWTVATHLRRVFAKLGVTSRAAMVTRLLRGGAADGQVGQQPPAHEPPVPVRARPAAATVAGWPIQ